MARTLLDFRIDKGLYIKDIAEKTGISEEELMAIEQSGTVPTEIAEILINDYCLTDTYFTIEERGKLTPQKPMNYFFKVSLVWSIIVGAIGVIPFFITSFCAAFSAASIASFFSCSSLLLISASFCSMIS